MTVPPRWEFEPNGLLVDVTPERTRDNFERLVAAPQDLQARIRTEGEPSGWASPAWSTPSQSKAAAGRPKDRAVLPLLRALHERQRADD